MCFRVQILKLFLIPQFRFRAHWWFSSEFGFPIKQQTFGLQIRKKTSTLQEVDDFSRKMQKITPWLCLLHRRKSWTTLQLWGEFRSSARRSAVSLQALCFWESKSSSLSQVGTSSVDVKRSERNVTTTAAVRKHFQLHPCTFRDQILSDRSGSWTAHHN